MKKFLTTLCIGFEKDEDSIVKQALLLSINLHSNGNTRFYSNIMELAKSYKLPNFVPNPSGVFSVCHAFECHIVQ